LFGVDSSTGGSTYVLTAGQDENKQPHTAATAEAGAALGAVNCITEGVLLPQAGEQQLQAAAQRKGPAEKPQLKKRRGQQQPWGAFKAPRKQGINKPVGAPSSSTAGQQQTGGGDAAAAAVGDVQAEPMQEPQQQDVERVLMEQQQEQKSVSTAFEAAVPVFKASGSHGVPAQMPSSTAAAVAVGRVGLRKAGAGRQAFQPPFKR
jgi:hypothetical protein